MGSSIARALEALRPHLPDRPGSPFRPRPDHQRRGLGSLLVAPAIERADEDGLACYLETSDPRNVAFYQRFGFEVVDDALALVPGGSTHVPMRRPVRGSDR